MTANQAGTTLSVVIPCFNASAYGAEAVESILAQTYTDFELILVDDGSTDNTPELLQSYAGDPRVSVLPHSSNQGLIRTLNESFQLAKGEFVARMDADDICEKTRLEKQMTRLIADPDLVVSATLGSYIGDKNGLIKYPHTPENIEIRLLFDNCILHNTAIFRKSWFNLNPIQYRFDRAYAEDYALWADVLKAGGKIEAIPEPLIQYRVHSASESRSKRQAQEHTANLVRKDLWEGKVQLTDTEWLLLDTLQFKNFKDVTKRDIQKLTKIGLKMETGFSPCMPEATLEYEISRFIVSALPRPRNVWDKLALVDHLGNCRGLVNALTFSYLYLKGDQVVQG